MIRNRTATCVAAAAFALLALLAPFAAGAAETYPAKPVHIVVTFPPGGSTDIMARTIQPQLERHLGRPIVIDNRPGAGGVIGVDAVAKAAPDGYVIGIAGTGALALNVTFNEKLPYDPSTDLAPISGLAKSPFLLASPLSLPAASIPEVIALDRAKPHSLSIGYGGNGTAMHLTALLFNSLAKLDLTLVPYRGTGPVTQDLVAGHIPLGITDIPTALSHIEAGRIKLLGITTRERFPMLPDVPTFNESGLPGYESIGSFGFVAPAGTPRDVITILNAAIVATIGDAAMVQQFRVYGAEPMPMKPEEFGAFIRSEQEKWARVAAQAAQPR
jgi:tripartite-type tricarboxylate transporter receptor subunit TctC